MIRTESIDFHSHLPPYRSLLNPNARYDYKTHKLIPLSQNDLNFLHSIFKNGGRSTPLLLGNTNKNNNNNNNNKYKNRHYPSDSISRNGSQYSQQQKQNQNQCSLQSKSRSRFNNSSSYYYSQSRFGEQQDSKSSQFMGDIEDNSSNSIINSNDIPPSTASSSSSIKSNSTSNFIFANNNRNNHQSTPFKMKYRSLLNDVGRTISLRLSNSNLIANSLQHSSGINSVSRSSTILGNAKFTSITNIKELPIEILDYIFYFIDEKSDYKNCLFTCKLFYCMSKPYYYENLEFTSTYRFAQFISYLRLNSEIGQYVKKIDLSGIKPGYDEDAENEANHYNDIIGENDEDEIVSLPSNKTLAGWRDWKFKNNPLYTIHPSPNALSKTRSNASYSQLSIVSSKSNSSQKSSSSKKFSKPFKYLKSKKRRRAFNNGPKTRKTPRLEYLKLPPNSIPTGSDKISTPHPLINKFLLNYSTSKDVPIGYVLHLINLCPNITSLNLGNLSLSTDYEISRTSIHKYQNFDLMNNHPKDLLTKIDNCMKFDGLDTLCSFDGNSIFNSHHLFSFKPHGSNVSTASSIYSVTTFTKPIRKYNSLLPPLPQTVSDISYLNKGDGKVYLSDLNLKSINNSYLKKKDESEVLRAITRNYGKRVLSYNYGLNQQQPQHQQQPIDADISGNLRYLNLSSMIWLNRTLIENFLKKLLTRRSNNLLAYGFYDNDEFSNYDMNDGSGEDLLNSDINSLSSESDSEDENNKVQPIVYKQDLIIDLTDSGMYKNLLWAKKLDLNTLEGCKLAKKIICNELKTPFEEFMIRERNRRGRLGENYLA
ncbi:COS111 [Candida jiufengensis]|uniref:COS111 n=1 Tax=Candida jiufengensis TaxID=497108 RepID=UPI0022251B2D|nr:COS111 [Candida jiufengensis]KAI5951263.1 COS111 [Candida jiufengensis]